jgi:hypothetical protein
MNLHVGILGYATRSVGIAIGDNGSPPKCIQFSNGIDWRSGEEFYASFSNILNTLLRSFQLTISDTKTVTAAVTGYDFRFFNNRFHQILRAHGDTTSQFHLSSLAEAAHKGAFMGRDGVLIRCGHSAAVYTQIGECRVITGGWNTFAGEEASSIWLGDHAIRCVTALHDKFITNQDAEFAIELLQRLNLESDNTIDAPTLLEELHMIRILREREWKERLYEIGLTVVEIAKSSSNGSTSALRLVDAGQQHLINLVAGGLTHAMVKEDFPFDLCFCGSLFKDLWYRTRLRELVSRQFPNARITHPLFSPTMGIALLAMENSTGMGFDANSFSKEWKSEFWAQPVPRT